MEDARFLYQQANRCYQLAWQCFDLRVAHKLNSLGNDHKAMRWFPGTHQAAKRRNWPSPKITENKSTVGLDQDEAEEGEIRTEPRKLRRAHSVSKAEPSYTSLEATSQEAMRVPGDPALKSDLGGVLVWPKREKKAPSFPKLTIGGNV